MTESRNPILDQYYRVPFMPRIDFRVPTPEEVRIGDATINYYQIRYANPSDVSRCAFLADKLWMGDASRRYANQIDESFRSRNGPRVFIAETGSALAGFCVVRESWIMPRAAELIGVNVDVKHQDKGLGRALVNHALELCAAQSVNYILLSTFKPGFFIENWGFEAIDSTEEGWLVMRLRINPNRSYLRG